MYTVEKFIARLLARRRGGETLGFIVLEDGCQSVLVGIRFGWNIPGSVVVLDGCQLSKSCREWDGLGVGFG